MLLMPLNIMRKHIPFIRKVRPKVSTGACDLMTSRTTLPVKYIFADRYQFISIQSLCLCISCINKCDKQKIYYEENAEATCYPTGPHHEICPHTVNSANISVTNMP